MADKRPKGEPADDRGAAASPSIKGFGLDRESGAERGDPAISFRVGQTWLSAPCSVVDEVCAWSEPTSVPRAPRHVPGVIVLRGQIVPVLDLHVFLDLAAPEPSLRDQGQTALEELTKRILVVSAKGMRVGLFCDEVGEIVEIAPEWRRRPEVFGDQTLGQYVTAEVDAPERLIAELDVPLLLERARVAR